MQSYGLSEVEENVSGALMQYAKRDQACRRETELGPFASRLYYRDTYQLGNVGIVLRRAYSVKKSGHCNVKANYRIRHYFRCYIMVYIANKT